MRDTLVIVVGLAAVWGTAGIAWVAAARVARRRGLTFLAAILDRRSWAAEPLLGVRAGLLAPAWLVAWVVAFFAAFAWRP